MCVLFSLLAHMHEIGTIEFRNAHRRAGNPRCSRFFGPHLRKRFWPTNEIFRAMKLLERHMFVRLTREIKIVICLTFT